MKHLLQMLAYLSLVACSSVKQAEETKAPEYKAELKMKSVIFYGDTINFDEPQIVRPTPNSDKITLIELGNGNRFGVKYFVSTLITGDKQELVHNVVFYEEVIDAWENLNATDHRESLTLGEEQDWGIGLRTDQGEVYFNAQFSYLVTEM